MRGTHILFCEQKSRYVTTCRIFRIVKQYIQANPLNHKQPDIHILSGSRGMLAAKQPLVVPMLLRLSHFKLDSYVVLVVSRQKGITLVFKTDPLQNVDINSTFDSIAVIQKFIQREIEGQLRQMFREDLPGIIHRLSQQWVKAKVEAPYLNKISAPSSRIRTTSASDIGIPPYGVSIPLRLPALGMRPVVARAAYMANGPRGRSGSMLSASSLPQGSTSTVASAKSPQVSPSTHEGHSDSEHFDPTYGLRPEGLPQKSVFSTFRSLFSPNKGLAELAEEESEIDEGDRSFDSGNWDDLGPDASFSMTSPSEAGEVQEYESVPAIGGGTITRPRVIHAHSQLLSPSESVSSRSRATPRPSRMIGGVSGLNRSLPSAPVIERAQSWAGHYNPYFAGATPLYTTPGPNYESDDHFPLHHGRHNLDYPLTSSPPHSSAPSLEHPSNHQTSPSSNRTGNSLSSNATHSIVTPPNPRSENGEGIQIHRPRRTSFSSNLDRFGSPPDHLTLSDHDSKIVLKPNLSSVSRLSMLSNSNHTLSPYTRTLEHFTVRSVPPRETTSSGSGSASERQPVKARRKRTFFLGKKPSSNPEPVAPAIPSRLMSPEPPLSDFDASDMDRYFRSRDELVPQYSDVHPAHVRRRSQYANDNST
jgi:mitochondrial distribution and morphology protein 34